MAKYCITGARSSDETRALKDEFKTWKWLQNEQAKWVWRLQGWKSIHEISDLLKNGDTVLTAKHQDGIHEGEPVELELRISDNDSRYLISEMPSE